MNLVVHEALSRLAIARASELDDLTAQVYLEGLADIEPQTVSRACADLAKLPRRDYDTALPSVGTIRERCQMVSAAELAAEAAAKMLPMPVTEDDEPRYFCLDCFDTAWRLFDCAGKGPQASLEKIPTLTRFPCARLKAHPPHSYAEPCKCIDTNPVIAADRKRQHERLEKQTVKAGR